MCRLPRKRRGRGHRDKKERIRLSRFSVRVREILARTLCLSVRRNLRARRARSAAAARYYFNLFFTFVVSGLWHGASAPMLVWGALHGAYMVVGAATLEPRRRACRALRLHRDGLPARVWQTLVTFVLVGFAWIFFGAPDLATAGYIVTHLFTGFVPTVAHLKESLVLLGLSADACVRFAVLFAALFAVDLAARDRGWRAWLSARRPWVQAVICYLLAAALVFWGNLGGGNSMYFQF